MNIHPGTLVPFIFNKEKLTKQAFFAKFVLHAIFWGDNFVH